jgi:hypothetical protein
MAGMQRRIPYILALILLYQPILLSFHPLTGVFSRIIDVVPFKKCDAKEITGHEGTGRCFHPALRLRGGGLNKQSKNPSYAKRKSSAESSDDDGASFTAGSRRPRPAMQGRHVRETSKSKKKKSRKKKTKDEIQSLSFENETPGKMKKTKRSGIDWDNWQKKSKMPDDEAALRQPIVGTGGSLYDESFRGGKLRRRKIRDGLAGASVKEIEHQAKAEADAIIRAAAMSLQDSQVHVGTLPLGDITGREIDMASQDEEWKKNLHPALRVAMDSEAKGMYFTGKYRPGGIPIYTNESTQPHPVTGEPVALKKQSLRYTVAAQEAGFEYKSKTHKESDEEPTGPQSRLTLQDTDGHDCAKRAEKDKDQTVGKGKGSDAKKRSGADSEEEEDRMEEESVEERSKEGKKKKGGVKDISELIRSLKKNKVTLTKRQRYQKHVMGFSKESMSRMVNGTLATDSAWGPHKVIGGTADPERGRLWGDDAEGLGRKRRDASWFRIDALKGNGKAQVQLALAYRCVTVKTVVLVSCILAYTCEECVAVFRV